MGATWGVGVSKYVSSKKWLKEGKAGKNLKDLVVDGWFMKSNADKRAVINTGGEETGTLYTGFPRCKQLSEGSRLTPVQPSLSGIGWQVSHPSGFHQCPVASLSPYDWDALLTSCLLLSVLAVHCFFP